MEKGEILQCMDAAERRLAVMLVSLTEDIKFIRKRLEASGFTIGTACSTNNAQNMDYGPKDLATIHRRGVRASFQIRSRNALCFESGRCLANSNRGNRSTESSLHGNSTESKRGYNLNPLVPALLFPMLQAKDVLIADSFRCRDVVYATIRKL